jgi:hypothetical protein
MPFSDETAIFPKFLAFSEMAPLKTNLATGFKLYSRHTRQGHPNSTIFGKKILPFIKKHALLR